MLMYRFVAIAPNDYYVENRFNLYLMSVGWLGLAVVVFDRYNDDKNNNY